MAESMAAEVNTDPDTEVVTDTEETLDPDTEVVHSDTGETSETLFGPDSPRSANDEEDLTVMTEEPEDDSSCEVSRDSSVLEVDSDGKEVRNEEEEQENTDGEAEKQEEEYETHGGEVSEEEEEEEEQEGGEHDLNDGSEEGEEESEADGEGDEEDEEESDCEDYVVAEPTFKVANYLAVRLITQCKLEVFVSWVDSSEGSWEKLEEHLNGETERMMQSIQNAYRNTKPKRKRKRISRLSQHQDCRGKCDKGQCTCN
jgi:hypothetical protein